MDELFSPSHDTRPKRRQRQQQQQLLLLHCCLDQEQSQRLMVFLVRVRMVQFSLGLGSGGDGRACVRASTTTNNNHKQQQQQQQQQPHTVGGLGGRLARCVLSCPPSVCVCVCVWFLVSQRVSVDTYFVGWSCFLVPPTTASLNIVCALLL